MVHEKNMINDANFLIGTKIVRDSERLRHDFVIDEALKSDFGVYVIKFMPRYLRTFIKRVNNRIFGRTW